MGDAPESGADQGEASGFVLHRERAEVLLLIDNLSANPDASALVERRDATFAEHRDGLPADWLEKVCTISWPPEDGPAGNQSEQAALLIRVRDYLNTFTRPASGRTIAFTLLVTQVWARGKGRRRAKVNGHEISVASRAELAIDAYPDLVEVGRRFGRIIDGMRLVLVILLVFTCGFSWYVAAGNAALTQLADARKALAVAEKAADDTADAADAVGKPTPAGPADPSPGNPPVSRAQPAAAATPEPITPFCADEAPGVAKQKEPQYKSLTQLKVCRELSRAREQVWRVQGMLNVWSHPLLWFRSADVPLRNSGAGETVAMSAGTWATIFGSAVLPVLYGFLGAGAAIMRSLSRKIAENTLEPRDKSLSLQQLALGAVIGACIGLFVGGGPTDNGLLGPVPLSGSALSFVAGFGVERVFGALEALIAHVFRIIPDVTPPTRSQNDPAPRQA